MTISVVKLMTTCSMDSSCWENQRLTVGTRVFSPQQIRAEWSPLLGQLIWGCRIMSNFDIVWLMAYGKNGVTNLPVESTKTD